MIPGTKPKLKRNTRLLYIANQNYGNFLKTSIFNVFSNSLMTWFQFCLGLKFDFLYISLPNFTHLSLLGPLGVVDILTLFSLESNQEHSEDCQNYIRN